MGTIEGRDFGVPTLQDVVSREAAFIRRTLSQLGVHANDVNDAAQQVVLGIHRGLLTFDPSLASEPDKALRAWIFGICERQAASCRRALRRRSEVIADDKEVDDQQSDQMHAEERWLQREREHLLCALLDRIPSERRLVVVAYDLEGMAMKEVALLLGIPVNTAWNRRRLGLEDLRAEWHRKAAAHPRAVLPRA